MWLLESDGMFARHETIDRGTEIDPATPAALPQTLAATVSFAGQADGRGFSAANRLRAMGFTGRLVAAGPLIPDQARHAFQSGFDAILVDDARVARHGEQAWANALRPAVPELYMPETGSRGPEHGIWAARHGFRAAVPDPDNDPAATVPQRQTGAQPVAARPSRQEF